MSFPSVFTNTNAYYFRHTNGCLLAPVYTRTEGEAWMLLHNQHDWCNASKANCELEKIKKGTEYERICNS